MKSNWTQQENFCSQNDNWELTESHECQSDSDDSIKVRYILEQEIHHDQCSQHQFSFWFVFSWI